MLIFALSIARRIEGPTSRPRARPRPTNPSLLPTTHVIAKFTRRPESVIRWTMFTSRTSSSSSGRRMSTISGSRTGNPVASASSNVVTSPFMTSFPSFVFGAHSSKDLRSCLRSGRISARLHLRLRGLEGLPNLRRQVGSADPVVTGQDLRVVRDLEARVDEPLQDREQPPSLRGHLAADVENRGCDALAGGPPAREEAREVRRGDVPRRPGP